MQHNLSLERRMTFLASLGSAVEYYDFVVYGMMVKYLKIVFFPPNNDSTTLLQFFSVFAIGYLARPFGGIIAGISGDRFGRKPIFLLLTILMAFSTLMISCLPSYSEVGLLATVLLIFCRLLQGLSFGGELPGATTIVAEFTAFQRRSFRASVVIASVSIGALSASFVLFLMTSFLTEAEIIAWGWRVPFIIGAVLGLVMFLARKNMIETPVFQSLQLKNRQGKPLKQLIQKHGTSVLTGLGLTTFISALVVVNLFFPYYISQYFHFPEKSIYFATTLSLIFSAFSLPFAGRLADRFSKESILKWTTLSYAILSIPIYALLSFQNMFCLILFMIIHQLFNALFSSCYFPLMINLFPASIRYTGIALCYNLAYVAMANLPTGLTALLNQFQNPLVVPLVLSCTAMLSFLAVLMGIRPNQLADSEISSAIIDLK